MPVISAGVVNKQGRIILARQFMESTRNRIEGLLSAFPRLLDASVNKQVAFIEAGTVRYVYQPLEELFLILVTTRKSNIVEDLATLHLMGRLIPEYVPQGISEATLEANAFHIFFALDEVVVGGRQESATVEQVHTYLRMESHEEAMALEAKRQQIENAKRITAENAHALREKRRAAALSGGDHAARGGPYGGIGSDDPVASSMYPSHVSAYAAAAAVAYGSHGGAPPPSSAPSVPLPSSTMASMRLGKAHQKEVMHRVQKEVMGHRAGADPASPPPPPLSSLEGPKETRAPASTEDIHVTIEERLSTVLNREGECGPVDLKGELSIFITDPHHDHVRLFLAAVSPDFTFKAHARINKSLFAKDHVLAMADHRPFPVQQPVTLLRWRWDSSARPPLPITLTCWPETESLTLEYELVPPTAPLEHLQLTLPLYGKALGSVTPSTGTYEIRDGCLLWRIPLVSERVHSSGNIEVLLAPGTRGGGAETETDVFFPVEVAFTSARSVGLVQVKEVVEVESGAPVTFSHDTRLVTGTFQIE